MKDGNGGWVGWAILALGALIFYAAWLGIVIVANLYGTDIGERLFN